MIQKIKYFILASLGFLFVVSPAYAASANANPVSTKSNEIKVRACEARQEAVKTRMKNLLRMATNMTEVFDKIENRVEQFYQNRVLPTGNTVSNYNTLVDTVKTKKEAVKTSLEKAKSDSETFSCKSDSPKTMLMNFRKDMLAVKTALKEYRTSIKNLIVAVHTAYKKVSTTPKPTTAEAD